LFIRQQASVIKPILQSLGSSRRSDAMVSNNCSASSQMQMTDGCPTLRVRVWPLSVPFRATFRTWGEDAGFPRDLLEESLGHQIGNSVERPYRRINSFNRRRAFMEAWADFCCGKRRGRKPQTASRLSRGLINAQP